MPHFHWDDMLLWSSDAPLGPCYAALSPSERGLECRISPVGAEIKSSTSVNTATSGRLKGNEHLCSFRNHIQIGQLCSLYLIVLDAMPLSIKMTAVGITVPLLMKELLNMEEAHSSHHNTQSWLLACQHSLGSNAGRQAAYEQTRAAP